jgi:hypothetical protein
VRTLVERLLHVEDEGRRELLEAASVLRQFDEATLLAVVGDRGAGLTPFARLCDLSIVEPTQHGLTLHDDVRRIIADDLRWRDPGRYDALRGRAIAYYRERAQSAGPAVRARLVCDSLFLSEQHRLRAALFGDERSGEVSVDAGRPGDHAAVQTAWRHWLGEGGSSGCDKLDPLLAAPGSRLRVARDIHGQVLGFGAFVPVSASTLSLLQRHAGLAATVRAVLDSAAIPVPLESGSVFCHTQVARVDAPQESTMAALLRDSFELLVQGGIHVACCTSPRQKVALQTLGFEQCATAADTPLQGYVLNLSRIDYGMWVAAVAAGRQLRRGLSVAEFEHELRMILPRWLDDEYLRRSSLWESSALAAVSAEHAPTELRAVLASMLGRLGGPPDAADHLAYRAVQLAYMTPRVSHEAAAERLAVSRATFYRLLKRGIRGLADALSRD